MRFKSTFTFGGYNLGRPRARLIMALISSWFQIWGGLEPSFELTVVFGHETMEAVQSKNERTMTQDSGGIHLQPSTR
ncbi:dna replication licensing factor mcm3 [Moniliophthora roreri]|nr:dna replication licensing factor mcm3 [Moniliophthora roreri]